MVRLWRSRPRSMVSAWTWQPAGARPAPTTAGSPAQGWSGRNLSVNTRTNLPPLRAIRAHSDPTGHVGRSGRLLFSRAPTRMGTSTWSLSQPEDKR